jgi:cell division transport system permease protein
MSKSLFKTSGSAISSFSTIVGITLVLIMVGLLLVVALLATSLSNHYRGQVVVQLMMKEGVAEEDIFQLKKRLDGETFTASTKYTSSQEAAQSMQEELGEEFVQFLGYNPLPASIDIRMNPTFNQQDGLQQVITDLESNPIVHEVVYQEDLLQQMNANLSKWSLGLVIIGALLLIIAVVLIVNTIQLAIFSQRFLIKSMQLVGATRWFIQKPFLKRGLWYGFISSVFALAIIFAVLYYFRNDFQDIIEILREQNRLLILIGGVFSIGLLMSWLATAYAVRKFVRTEAAKLH